MRYLPPSQIPLPPPPCRKVRFAIRPITRLEQRDITAGGKGGLASATDQPGLVGCAKEAAGRAETSAIADAVESKGEADAVERGSKLVPRPEPGEADRPRFEELKRVVRDGIETF